MLSNNKCILAYGLTAEEISKLEKLNHNVKIISKEMTSMKIKDIVEGLKIEVVSKDVPDEKVLLFNNYDDSSVKKGVKDIRTITKDGILAVVTPISRNWSFAYLINHLIEEKEWANNQKKGR